MIGFIVGACLFSIPTIYYRIKLKEAERRIKRHIQTRWMWEDWGE
jgi:uncharacterized membrane protein YciS (DUF1049 family)